VCAKLGPIESLTTQSVTTCSQSSRESHCLWRRAAWCQRARADHEVADVCDLFEFEGAKFPPMAKILTPSFKLPACRWKMCRCIDSLGDGGKESQLW